MEKDYALTTVVVIALACMMSVLIVGQILKPAQPHTVDCSITIEHGNKVFSTYVGKGEVY